MSQLNFTSLSEPENQLHHQSVKQFGASDLPRSAMKKTALTDVKNILAQRNVHTAKKTLTSTKKSTTSKKSFFGIFSDKENYTDKKEIKKYIDMNQMLGANTCSGSVFGNKIGCDIKICPFCNKVEDDCADILMQSITLSKSEVDRLALEWGRQPVVGLEDMRKLEIPAADPNGMVAMPILDLNEFDEQDLSLLNDIPCL